MRISGWSIDGFGLFRDLEIRDLSRGLTVVLGPNEAGKTTLLAFLRGVLFGFPSGQKGKAHYPPLHGGRHGGRVLLEDGAGTITIEREVGRRLPRILLPGGAEETEEGLRRLLGGADGALFRSVFAFSLAELQDLRSLSVEGVRDRIFSAGIAGAGRSARTVIDRLQAEADRLLRPRSGGVINRLCRELETAEDALDQAVAAAESYPTLVAGEQELEERISHLEGERTRLLSRQRELELVISLWPLHRESQDAIAELRSLEPVDEFPPDPEARLAAALEALTGARGKAEEIECERDAKATAVAQIREELDDALMRLAPTVEELHAELGLQRDRLEKLPEARNAQALAEATFELKLRELGPGWNERVVGRFDASLSRFEEAREWGRVSAAAEDRVATSERARAAARDDFALAEAERERLATALASLAPVDEGRLEAEEQTLRRLRAGLQDLSRKEMEARDLEALVNDRRRGLLAIEGRKQGDGRHWESVTLAAIALLAVAGAIWGGQGAGLQAALLPGIIAVVALFVLAAPHLLNRHVGGSGVSTEAMIMTEELESLDSRLARARAEAQLLSSQIERDASVLELPLRPSSFELEERSAELGRIRELLRRRQWLEERLAEAEAKLAQAEAGMKTADELLAEAVQALEKARNGWQRARQRAGLPEELSPEGALEFLRRVQGARDVLGGLQAARKQVEQLETQAKAWEDWAQKLLEEAGSRRAGVGGADRDESLVAAVLALHGACRAELADRERLSLAEEELRELDIKRDAARRDCARAEAALAALFREGGAEEETSFRKRLAVFTRRRDLRVLIGDREAQLRARVGHGADADSLLADLASGRVAEWHRELEQVGANVSRTEEQLRATIANHRDAERARQELEESADVPRAELELESLRSEVDEHLRRWRVVVAAQALVEETLSDFIRTRQPDVLREASATFARVTAGRYHEVLQSGESDSFLILQQDGKAKLPEQLSRGTQEQLYLCLRLGLAAEFRRRAVAVPLVMDDVLVNFDPVRARAMAEVLVDFARSHQVLLFTCHPHTAMLLQEADKATVVVRLPDGGTERPAGAPAETGSPG